MESGTVPARYGQSREVGEERESVVCPWAICPPPPSSPLPPPSRGTEVTRGSNPTPSLSWGCEGEEE